MADTSAGSSSGANGTASGGPTASSGAHSAGSTAASNGGFKPRGRRRGATGAAALQRTPSATKRLAERSARQRQSLMSSRMHSDPSLLKVGGRGSAARARSRRRGGRNITDLSGTTLARKRHRGSVEARALAALAARKRREADRTRQLVANLELEHLVKPLRTKRLNMKQALYVDGCCGCGRWWLHTLDTLNQPCSHGPQVCPRTPEAEPVLCRLAALRGVPAGVPVGDAVAAHPLSLRTGAWLWGWLPEWLLHLVVHLMVVCLLTVRPRIPHAQSEAIRDLFFDEEFTDVNVKKNFDNVWVEAEFWEWVDGPLINGMYVHACHPQHYLRVCALGMVDAAPHHDGLARADTTRRCRGTCASVRCSFVQSACNPPRATTPRSCSGSHSATAHSIRQMRTANPTALAAATHGAAATARCIGHSPSRHRC